MTIDVEFFDNIPTAVGEGLVTTAHIETWLDLVGLEGDERVAKVQKTIREDGTLVQFQVVSLHRMAHDAWMNQRAAALVAVDEAPIPEEYLKDVPEPVYDEPLPDMAGEIKKRLGIIAAVRKFGKPQDRIKDNRTEGVKVRCPFDSHNDADPSAWCNTEKGTWYCGRCEVGGDVIDFFAARQGYDPKTFHKNGDFSEVVKRMGAELGLSVQKRSGTFELVDDNEEWPSPLPDAPEEELVAEPRGLPVDLEYGPLGGEESDPTPAVPAVPESHEAREPVTITDEQMMRGIAFDSFDPDDATVTDYPKGHIPSLNWRDLPINPHSYLGEWMTYAEEYYPWVPHEYFLFAGLQAIGLATGNFMTSFTGAPLSGSLMLAMIGPSGHGKSTAVSELRKMMTRVPGVKFDPDFGTGVKIIPSPGSAEALVKSIYTEVEMAASPVPGAKEEVGVTAWLHEDEFATIVEKSKRRGGGVMKTRLIQLYDFVKSKDEKELVIEDFSLGAGLRGLHDSYFSAVFTTQTDALRSMMDSTDLISGFLNRIVPVMGPQRQRRRIADAVQPPATPDHDAQYNRLWHRCRQKRQVVPFTQGALELVDNHTFLLRVEKLAANDSLYSRINHMTCRIAFLLAVNNFENEVEPKYVNAACEVGSSYLMDCFFSLRQSVIATQSDDAASRIMNFVQRFFDNHKVWPTSTQWQKDRSYSDFDSDTRQRALDTLFNEGRLVRLKLQNGKGIQKALVIPLGQWVAYADSHEKKYKLEDVYA